MRSPRILSAATTAFAFYSLASASCNPLKNTTCPSDPALGKTITVDFTKGESSYFTEADGTTITYGSDGAVFSIESDGSAKTIYTSDYIFFGKVEVALRAANGTGIVSSFVLISDDLDEIDWEWLGGDSTQVESNYFGKGNTTTYDRAVYHTVSDPQDEWHIYTIDWTSAHVKWYIDGTLIRTLLYADALDGKNFPQTPMQVKIGNWVGGSADASEGTVEWAGGYTDLTEAPFTMYVRNVTIEDYTTSGTEYTYGDQTGDYTSIVISGSSSSSSYSSSSSTSSSSSSNSSSISSSTSSTSSNASSTSTSTSSSSSTTASTLTSAGVVKEGTASLAFVVLALGAVLLNL